jgi:NAD(P)-dependent dehydrogenase (short-subunit alcohol dehydrogenase family)
MAGMCEGGVALVTGGGSGIGRQMALIFAREGAAVVVADLNEAGAKETAEQVRAAGGRATPLTVDLSDDEAIATMVGSAVESYGRIDYAANNAGVSDPGCRFHELSRESWDRMIAINLTSVFVCMQHELRQMLAQEPRGGARGAIVNTSSGAGVIPAPGLPHYTAAKHGVLGLTKNAAQEYANKGIRTNAILPGLTDTGLTEQFIQENPHAKAILAALPGGRLGQPDEVAEAGVWLCSQHARWVNGQSLIVDGGGVLR